MPNLLINQENDETLLLERNGLLNNSKNKTVYELEAAIKDSMSDLPLGKALNLLINIHSHVFDKAVSAIQESSPNELASQIIEFPTIRALISLENHLTSSNDIGKSFKHIYESFEEKFIKRSNSNSSSEPAMRIIGYLALYSKHKKYIQQCISQKLNDTNKRSQLATVVLFQFLFKTYISEENGHCDLSALLIPPLLQISEKYGDLPTLLACSSCELVIHFTGYIALHVNDPVENTLKITELNSPNNDRIQQLSSAFNYADRLFYIMEKWSKPTNQLELASYKELHLFLQYAVKNVTNKVQQYELTDAWNLISTYLTPKSILSSNRPLSLKKQKSILLFKNTKNNDIQFISNIKITLLILLNNNRLVELYGFNRSYIIYTNEEEEVKKMFTTEYKNMIQSYPIAEYENIGNYLIPQLVSRLPFLCTTNDIYYTELIQLIIDKIEFTTDNIPLLTQLIIKQPESTIGNLLLHVVQQDEKSEFSYNLLGHIISLNDSNIIDSLESNLLFLVKSSNQACELLIQCMTYTNLPYLIQKLMSMTVVNDEREKMTCIALISKALLHERWASSSILLYIEMVRNVNSQKGFVQPVEPNFEHLRTLKPNSITRYEPTVDKVYEDEELATICASLMFPIQLWSTKATEESLKNAMIQLVHKSYALTVDYTIIEAWKHLSFAFLNNHGLIWEVVEQCLDIMKSQPIITPELKDSGLKETILYLRLSPMLILQTIPKESYDLVKLPKSYTDLVSSKFAMIGIDPHTIKRSIAHDKHTQLNIQLMDELLLRSSNISQSPDNSTSFPIVLITKIFCK